jgi:hypothetical protein
LAGVSEWSGQEFQLEMHEHLLARQYEDGHYPSPIGFDSKHIAGDFPLVSAFQISVKIRNDLLRREKRHSKSLNLISKTMIFCQEKNMPVYVMWNKN